MRGKREPQEGEGSPRELKSLGSETLGFAGEAYLENGEKEGFREEKEEREKERK